MVPRQPTPKFLWHFTCSHSRQKIGKRGTLKPVAHPLLPELGPMVWMTDNPQPEPISVGLTSVYTKCDRMEFRYRADARDALPWMVVRQKVSAYKLEEMEAFGAPETWFVSFKPVKVLLQGGN